MDCHQESETMNTPTQQKASERAGAIITKIGQTLRDEPIVLEGGVVYVGQVRYPIGLDQIRDKADVLQWVHHLTDKKWITPPMIGRLVEVLCAAKNWPVYRKSFPFQDHSQNKG